MQTWWFAPAMAGSSNEAKTCRHSDARTGSGLPRVHSTTWTNLPPDRPEAGKWSLGRQKERRGGALSGAGDHIVQAHEKVRYDFEVTGTGKRESEL